jgi:hypothetical protein
MRHRRSAPWHPPRLLFLAQGVRPAARPMRRRRHYLRSGPGVLALWLAFAILLSIVILIVNVWII